MDFNQMDLAIENLSEEILKNYKEAWGELSVLANKRLSLCNECPLFDRGICSSEIEGLHVETKEATKGCGCELELKVLNEQEECPLGKW